MRLVAVLAVLLLTACSGAESLTPPAPTVQRVTNVTRAEWDTHTGEEHLNFVRYTMRGMRGCHITPEQVNAGIEAAYRNTPALQDPPALILATLATQNGCLAPGQ